MTDRHADEPDPGGNFTTSAPERQQVGRHGRDDDWHTTRNHTSKNEDNRYVQKDRGG